MIMIFLSMILKIKLTVCDGLTMVNFEIFSWIFETTCWDFYEIPASIKKFTYTSLSNNLLYTWNHKYLLLI